VSDETAALRREFPGVRAIRSETNLGFAGANNLGFERSSGKYVLFLNPDTEVVGPAIATMLAKLKSLPAAGILGCKLLNSDGSLQTSCIQRFPTILNQILDAEVLRLRWPQWKLWGSAPLFSDSPEPAIVEVVSGACLMIERATLERAGRFSTQYLMYAEDVELCYQVRRLGLNNYYTGEAVVVHHGGGSSREQKGNQWVAIMQRQAIFRFCRNTRGRGYAAAYRMAMAMNAACRLLLLGITYPFRGFTTEQGMVYSTPAKWISVLQWALGLDRGTARLHETV
jgi:GT2 family glycosyltransferase